MATKNFDYYWMECDDFRTDDDDEAEEPHRVFDDDSDADWLRDAGFDFVLSEQPDDDGGGDTAGHRFGGSSEDLCDVPYMRTLSREQAAAVRKRMDTVTLKRKRHPPKLDVRDVFAQPRQQQPSRRQVLEDVRDSGSRKWQIPAPSKGQRRLSPESGQFRHREQSSASTIGAASSVPKELPSYQKLWKNHWHQHDLKNSDTVATPDIKGVAVIGYKQKGTVRHVPELLFQDWDEPEEQEECESTVRPKDDWALQPGFDASFCPRTHDQELPLVMVTERPPGVTQLGHLSPADQHKIGRLTLIELTALYDDYGLSYSRRKHVTRKRNKESLLYGVSLATLLEQDAQRGFRSEYKVPSVIRQILDYLRRYGIQEEGILRVSGSAARIDCLKADLEACYSRGDDLHAVLHRYGPHEVAAVLKQMLRDLPEPLLTSKYMDAFMQVQYLPALLKQLKALNLLVLLLPDAHRDTLLTITNFLADVTDLERKNKMSLLNVSMIMAPNLFTPKRYKLTQDNLHVARVITMITKMLIWYRHLLWNVPSQLMDQVRLEYKIHLQKKNVKEHKAKKKIHKKERGTSSSHGPNMGESPLSDGLLRVHVDRDVHSNAPAYTVKFNDATTAGCIVGEVFLAMNFEARKNDIVSSLWTSEQVPVCNYDADTGVEGFLQQHFLYEVGGTIGWRQLEHSANIMSVCQENPTAEWVVRRHHPK